MRLNIALILLSGQIAFAHAQDGEPPPFGRLVDAFPEIHLKAAQGFDCPLIDGGFTPEADIVDYRNRDGQNTVERQRKTSAVYFVHPRVTRSHLKNAFKGLYFCHLSGTFISVHAEVNRCHDAKN